LIKYDYNLKMNNVTHSKNKQTKQTHTHTDTHTHTHTNIGSDHKLSQKVV